MKKIIRSCTFETNSSSSHSLVVTKKDEYFTHEEIMEDMYINSNGIISFWVSSLDFGRQPNAPLYSFVDKLRYLIACFGSDEIKLKELLDTVMEIVPEINSFKFPKYDWDNDNHYYGCIDHQSYGMINLYLDKNNISFKEFLMNKKYIIILDGDEYCVWDTMKKCGLINKNFIQEEYDGWED